MCLIVIRDKGVTLPLEDFKNAVKNNPDGWGISAPDGEGRLWTFKSLTTNPEELYEYLHSEFKDDRFLLHLRYTTAGDTIIRNSHPFSILEAGPDGSDLRMAHNGTIHKWKPKTTDTNSWESDSRFFTREFVRPLFKRLVRGNKLEEILKDKFVEKVLEDQIPNSSVLSFIDGSGNTLVINPTGNTGFYDDKGTYFSNKYSFNPTHREPKGGWGTGNFSHSKGVTDSTITKGSGKSTSLITTEGDTLTKRFTVEQGITDWRDLYYLSDETIEALVEKTPYDAELLIKELLGLLYSKDLECSSHQKALKIKDEQEETLKEKLAKCSKKVASLVKEEKNENA